MCFKTNVPVTSLRVLTASRGEMGVAVIDGNIPGLWANTLRGKSRNSNQNIFDMLIKCQTTVGECAADGLLSKQGRVIR